MLAAKRMEWHRLGLQYGNCNLGCFGGRDLHVNVLLGFMLIVGVKPDVRAHKLRPYVLDIGRAGGRRETHARQ